MSLDLFITTKISEKEVAKALNEFVNISFERTKGKSVSTWKKKDNGYLLSISYMPQNFISDKMLQMALEGSFKKQDETAKVEVYKEKKK